MRDLAKLLVITTLCVDMNFTSAQWQRFSRNQKSLPYDLMTNSDHQNNYNKNPYKIIFYESAFEQLLPKPTFAPAKLPARLPTGKPRKTTKQPIVRDEIPVTRKPLASSTRNPAITRRTTPKLEPQDNLHDGQFFVPFKKIRQEGLHKNSTKSTSTFRTTS